MEIIIILGKAGIVVGVVLALLHMSKDPKFCLGAKEIERGQIVRKQGW